MQTVVTITYKENYVCATSSHHHGSQGEDIVDFHEQPPELENVVTRLLPKTMERLLNVAWLRWIRRG